MPKRRNSVSSEEESEHEDSNLSDTSDAPISGKSSGKKKPVGKPMKKPKFANDEAKPEQSENTAENSEEIKVHVNSVGEKYIDLGKKKRAVVRSFKGIALLDIREFYGADGEEKPGKKGISLTLDQWKLLSESSSAIDKLFEEQKKK